MLSSLTNSDLVLERKEIFFSAGHILALRIRYSFPNNL